MTRIDWREASRWWSVRVSALGSILYAAMILMPDQLLALWNMMPSEVRAALPARAGDWLGMILFIMVIIVRLLPQRPATPPAGPAVMHSTSKGITIAGDAMIRGSVSVLGDKAGKVAPRTAARTAAIAAALALAIVGLKADEGKRNTSYVDIAGVATACYGHTGPDVKPGQVRTDAQCETLLREDARAHMAGALACSPMLADHPNQLAAVTRLTFNIGVTGYCRSSIARHFAAGRWRPGCDRFLAFRYAGGREVRGLLLRRQRERALCLTGLPA
ncbi:GH24 family phage-related lysozyme (muramidase) [Sphingomonas sp. SORGH_AS802]|jgi:lysozyme|uniref:lysozyme n=1 Tax=unclassified Sphingomonas TaxID=196159 RepID=UPI0028638BB5|nr:MULTISPECIES: lysozyme [unclassified Sphingomonas]MDR6128778.1 GH24 family phage-related lysozyme (muramidase) [Sphingomonas sp. SORGH_AS_0438]MDR6136207.1 GH24 family phage-related lysozyme (muramidase) [Sphingomonas sp. SORGH_AS_0802]